MFFRSTFTFPLLSANLLHLLLLVFNHIARYFEITEDNGARKIIKRDYKALDCEGPSTAVEYLEGDCSNGHFSYSSAKDPQGTYGALAPNFANPFAEMQPNNPLN